jgi:hypothetical protein
MFYNEIEEVKTVIENIAKGINPITEEPIRESCLLNDARMIRCLHYLVKILQKKKRRSKKSGKKREFIITPEQKRRVTLPPEKIGIYGFESKRRSFNGDEYDQVLINENGKKYLLENIEMLMEMKR